MTTIPEHHPDEFEYVPDPFGRLGRGTRRRRRRAIEPEFAFFRQTFDSAREPDDLFEGDATALEAAVGREEENQRFDVARVETLLGRTGHLDLDATEGPTGYFGARLEDAIRRFQKEEGLKVDGLRRRGRIVREGPKTMSRSLLEAVRSTTA